MFLYVIKCGKHIKIGITNNIEKRLKTLQTGNAEPMEVARTVEIPDDKANAIETYMHRRFAKYKVKNEWFDKAALPEILKMTDAQIICCKQNQKKVLFKYQIRVNNNDEALSADFATEEIADIVNGFVIFKSKNRKPASRDDCKNRKWYLNTDGLLRELNRDYEECLSRINRRYETCRQYVESYEGKVQSLRSSYESFLEDIKELKSKYESDM